VNKKTSNPTIGSWLIKSSQLLLNISETPQLDAHLIAAHVFQQSRTWVITHVEKQLSQDEILTLDGLLEKRLVNIPLPYILGQWEFFGMDFEVSPAVLIPRPETELLVEEAIEWLKRHPHMRNVADVGTGSGCIAISIACQIPNANITAIDISEETLQITSKNIERHARQKQIKLIQNNLLSNMTDTYDLICSNPPYIPSATLDQLQVKKHEPVLALDGGQDGLKVIGPLLGQAKSLLSANGMILIEIEASIGLSALNIAHANFPQRNCEIIKDLAGHDRILKIY
jgi:release factor glutamine methyltransferase